MEVVVPAMIDHRESVAIIADRRSVQTGLQSRAPESHFNLALNAPRPSPGFCRAVAAVTTSVRAQTPLLQVPIASTGKGQSQS